VSDAIALVVVRDADVESLCWDDLFACLPTRIPAVLRELGPLARGCTARSSFNDFVGIDALARRLRRICHSFIDPPQSSFSLRCRGVLFTGASGTGLHSLVCIQCAELISRKGKTALALACAEESGANFVAVQGPELTSKFVGQTEASIRNVFAIARQAAPCVLFFDQFEVLARKRGFDSSASQFADRVLSCLLTEMDGMATSDHTPVLVLAATSRPELLDEAIKRPGRFDEHIALTLPDTDAREELLQRLVCVPLTSESGPCSEAERRAFLRKTAEATQDWTCGRLKMLWEEAALRTLRTDISAMSCATESINALFK
jgi:AAA+ superfamily predicted ATPase